MIYFQNFKRQWSHLGDEILKITSQVGETGWFILGEHLLRFESELAQKTKFTGAQGVGNGLDAIELSLRALGIKTGDLVLTTPLSAFATTLAIVRAGGVPVFCDTDTNGLIDLDIAAAAIEKCKIKYFVPVHLYGQLIDIQKLNSLRSRYGLKVVEDAAQAVCAHNFSSVKTESELIATSFYPTKNLGALGDGGAVLSNNKDLIDRVGLLKNYGQSDKYVHDYLGMNSRLDELQAAYLSLHLKYLDEWLLRRKAIGERYMFEIENPLLKKLTSNPGTNVWHLFPVFLDSSNARDHFVKFMHENKVQTSIHYPHLMTKQKALEATNYHLFGATPRADHIVAGVVSLPLHPYLNEDEVSQIVSACNRWSYRN